MSTSGDSFASWAMDPMVATKRLEFLATRFPSAEHQSSVRADERKVDGRRMESGDEQHSAISIANKPKSIWFLSLRTTSCSEEVVEGRQRSSLGSSRAKLALSTTSSVARSSPPARGRCTPRRESPKLPQKVHSSRIDLGLSSSWRYRSPSLTTTGSGPAGVGAC